ncbi:hypothetical protein [Pseudalkalibacillus caeni]|uniref:Uncharacterized protein n=1 Tax=Exobacillus caeni TaxID=2574798 RepID=A0A5R9F3H9_9BACL|nr:hypothetical protein [Pseudalkalibacillus caeni]TLS37049.1 hypothetical protein FCL54_10995 [Pseudalkalibacillus caeni]
MLNKTGLLHQEENHSIIERLFCKMETDSKNHFEKVTLDTGKIREVERRMSVENNYVLSFTIENKKREVSRIGDRYYYQGVKEGIEVKKGKNRFLNDGSI